jgi:glucose-1-phosphate thymidylyltransferase
MWGIVPAAGLGSRIQPLAFSKELLPVGSRSDGAFERPRAVSEYLIERMIISGVRKICIIISPGKSDIVEYYGGGVGLVHICYVVQPEPKGLCDAIFRSLPLVGPHEHVVVGLPDTIWFPEDGLQRLQDGQLSFLLFPIERPELFDAVCIDAGGNVVEVQVKTQDATSRWIWGAFKLTGAILAELHTLWLKRNRADEYIGTLVNAYLQEGGRARGVCLGQAYVDVGTLDGYREAIHLLESVLSK